MTTAADLSALIRSDIAAALADPHQTERMKLLRGAAEQAFRIAYDEEPGDPKGVDQATADFLNQINGAMGQTHPDGTDAQVDRIADIWGVAAANAAKYYSAPKAFKTWVTRLDDRVRDHHIPMHGVTVAAGQMFDVSGYKLHYPGEPVGPPDIWINCRCTLDLGVTAAADIDSPLEHDHVSPFTQHHHHPLPAIPYVDPPPSHSHTISYDHGVRYNTTSDPALLARTYTTDQRERLAAKGHALPDGSFPIADLADLRNAIQAIGRASDPAKARAHIRKRARALGHADLIPDSWTASAEEVKADGLSLSIPEDNESSLSAWARSTSPPGTHDGPGWLTHPRETARIRRYWVHGPGAAKIGWGSPNDLTRCAKFMSKYMTGRRFIWGTCQNMHKEALGYWNPESKPSNRRSSAEEMAAAGITDETTPEVQALIDDAFLASNEFMEDPMLQPPSEWFADPGFDGPTPLTITSDGRVLGHLATWGTCHVGYEGQCVEPPRSNTSYAHFRTGEVETADGQRIPVGQITMETGHAGKGDGAMAAASHYDDTGTGVADVAAGEDQYGIWVAGAMRPGVSEQQMYVLKATGALSGDWRRIGGNLELVAALVVNVPGFPIPRIALAASGELEMSLVAAGIVTTDPNAVDPETVAIAVIARLDRREAEKARRARADALLAAARGIRAEALVAAVR